MKQKNIFFFFGLTFLSFLFACQSNQSFDDLLETYHQDYLRLYPLDAISQGNYSYNNLLPNDATAAYRKKEGLFNQKYLKKLETYDIEKLTPNQKISHQLLKKILLENMEGATFDIIWQTPITQFNGLHLYMPLLGSGNGDQPFKTVKNYEEWHERLSQLPPIFDTFISNFNQGIKAGNVLPEKLVVKIIPQLEAIYKGDVEKNVFLKPVNNFPESFDENQKKELKEKYVTLVNSSILPAYKKLRDYLSEGYLAKASKRSTIVNDDQLGKKYYAFSVQEWTTTKKTPEEIYQIGLSEVDRIKKEMEVIKKQVGFKGNLKAFFKHLKTSPKMTPFKTPEEVIQAFESIHQKVKPHLSNLFSVTPKTPFEIRQTEKFREASASAEYSPGSPDGTRPGIFYIPIIDATKFNITSGMESLFLHEAIPGHHYQISLQQENRALPKFRNFAWYGAYGEGWALYCESIGGELGLYTDPYQKMGALGDEMHRAIRLVVDVGLHAKEWTREKAIRYMRDNEPISDQWSEAEIERYMSWPGQALSYKIGALKIQELRNKYQELLNNKFSLADFHYEYLKDGGLPLDIVESKMDAWANNQ